MSRQILASTTMNIFTNVLNSNFSELYSQDCLMFQGQVGDSTTVMGSGGADYTLDKLWTINIWTNVNNPPDAQGYRDCEIELLCEMELEGGKYTDTSWRQNAKAGSPNNYYPNPYIGLSSQYFNGSYPTSIFSKTDAKIQFYFTEIPVEVATPETNQVTAFLYCPRGNTTTHSGYYGFTRAYGITASSLVTKLNLRVNGRGKFKV